MSIRSEDSMEIIGNIYENPEFMKIDVHNFR